MLKCSYILLVYNNERTIFNVIDSLKKINDNFRREFIIIDDGSDDDSLNIIKNAVKDLPRTTIITHDHIGSGLSVNKALSLVKADYIHFVNGFETLSSSSTSELIDCCIKSGAEVAFYSSKLLKNEEQFKLIDEPIKEILINQIPNIRNIGLQGTLVSYNLLMKIEQADEEVYTLNPSISLKCAQHSKFAVINKKLSGQKNSELKAEQDINFHLYNNLLAIYNSVKKNPSAFEKYLNELIYNLYKDIKTPVDKINYFIKHLLAKYLIRYDLHEVLEWYKIELKKLF